MAERIAKVIARAGLCSRRDAEQWIEQGRVSVEGEDITSPAFNVTPTMKIRIDGEALPKKEEPRVWKYYKPKGLVTSHRDEQGRKTIFDSLPPYMPRVISVGRLDLASEGLLLLTNDGDIARHLELPSTGWKRRYRVRVHGYVSKDKLQQLKKGIKINGVHYDPVDAVLDKQQGTNAWITMTLKEGKNREIRRIMEHFGWPVSRLIRVSYGAFLLGHMKDGHIEEIPQKVLKEQLGKFFTCAS